MEAYIKFMAALAQVCLFLATKFDLLATKGRRWVSRWMTSDDGPSYIQWANRLVEFIDTTHIVEVYGRFERLVQSGIAPDHAFWLVTR